MLYHAKWYTIRLNTHTQRFLLRTRMNPTAGNIAGALNTTPLSNSGCCIATNAVTVPP